jgi:hypothetical protein
MPNVPNAPGVPPLSSFATLPLVLLTADVIPPLFAAAPPIWGVFLDGEPVVESDSTISVEFIQDFPITNAPVEQGAFLSYDKVQLPATIRVRVSAGGDDANRANFLTSIDAVMNTTDLYDVVTPEETFMSYNFTHRDWRRTARNGVGLIQVDLWLTEVRVVATTTFSSSNANQPQGTNLQNTKEPGDSAQVGNGNVQPMTPPPVIQQEFSGGGWQ